MIDNKLWKILEVLSGDISKTSEEIGNTVGVSEKTIRVRIKELNVIIKNHGAEIISKRGFGYLLKISSQQKWDEFFSHKDKIMDTIPTTSEERIRYLIYTLLNKKHYIKIADMVEVLYISQKTISYELRKVEFILRQFNIKVERKPYYGIRILGNEFDRRRCILQNFMLSQNTLPGMNDGQDTGIKEVAKVLLELRNKYSLRFSESAFQNLVVYVYLSIQRMKQGMYIENIQEDESKLVNEQELKVAEELFRGILKNSEVGVRYEEIYYAGIYIAGKRIIGNSFKVELNFVIPEKIDNLVLSMLNEIYQTFKIEFRDNLNLRMMLNKHLIPMDVRLRFGIPVENPMLKEIKEKYFFAFTMAHQASISLSQYYNKIISEDEIGYLALSFAVALEQKKAPIEKKNILLVCASGKASSQLLMYKFKEEFGDYIDSLSVCNVFDLNQYDISKINYIFTTVPIFRKVNIPILEIHDFLKRYEIIAVKELLKTGDLNFLKEFYNEDFFFTGIKGESKEEVLKNLCNNISGKYELPEGFYDSILKREGLGATNYRNLVAIPYPFQIMTKDTIVAVAVLEKEILWSTNMVQMIIMVALSEEKNDNIQRFYEVTTKFVTNKTAVKELLKEQTFDKFISLLSELGDV